MKMVSVGSMFVSFPLLVCFLSIQILPESEAINCFVCNSRNDRRCEYLLSNDTDAFQYVACNEFTETGAPPFCRKIVQYVKTYDVYRVIRKCGYERHPHKDCYTVKNSDHDETVCQCFENGCNSSAGVTASILILGMSIYVLAANVLC